VSVLLIDAGNSRIKWRLGEAGGVLDTADAVRLGNQVSGKPERIFASNVAGAAVQAAMEEALAPNAITWVCASAKRCGVTNGYAQPAQLGSDRWCGLIATWRRFQRTALVVNAGTTMTVDALSAQGVFLGGVIVPGLTLMRTSLARGTAQLHERPGAFEPFPGNTGDAICSGALHACAGAVDRMRAHLREAGNGEPLTVLSGGSSRELLPALNAPVEVVDNLVLDGLLEIARDDGVRL
jgi:type III pantothenate kinase